MLAYSTVFFVTTLTFALVDLIWLCFIARPVYKHFLGHLLRPEPYWPAAILFYILFILGMMVFVIVPALKQHNVAYAWLYGALFGFFTYMTYELTNLAVLDRWPKGIVLIDIAWGTVLCSAVCGLSCWVLLKYAIGSWH